MAFFTVTVFYDAENNQSPWLFRLRMGQGYKYHFRALNFALPGEQEKANVSNYLQEPKRHPVGLGRS